MSNEKIREDNFFATKGLNRLSEFRINENWVKEKLSSSNALIIPVSNFKVLLSGDSILNPVFLNPANFKNLESIYQHFILLGEKDGSYYFCVNLEDIGIPQEYFSDSGEFRELRFTAPLIDGEKAGLLAFSRAMVYWHKNHLYCGACGYPTSVAMAGHKRICTNPNCKKEHFPRTDPAIIVLVSNGDKCLLARQPHWRKGQYATIAGYVEPGESLEQAVEREVFEETGIVINKVWYRSSQPWPFPTAIMLGFRAESQNTNINLRDHELEDAKWFTREKLRDELLNGKMKFPPPVSISFRLIQEWHDQDSKGNLLNLLKESESINK